MSELTPCNHCTLQNITRRAVARGATVTTRQETLPELVQARIPGDGWIVVSVSDQAEPVAWFKALTTHCVC